MRKFCKQPYQQSRFLFLQMVEMRQQSKSDLNPKMSSNTPFSAVFLKPKPSTLDNLSANRMKKCPICAYKTPYSGALARHVRFKHTKEKPFPCPLCAVRFAVKTNLDIHMRIHTGVKPYHCSHCGSKFRQLSHLHYHLNKKAKCYQN